MREVYCGKLRDEMYPRQLLWCRARPWSSIDASRLLYPVSSSMTKLARDETTVEISCAAASAAQLRRWFLVFPIFRVHVGRPRGR